MISRFYGEFPENIPLDDPIAGKIEMYYRAYGTRYDFCRFFISEGMMAAVYEGELIIYAEETADFEEIALFVSAQRVSLINYNAAAFAGLKPLIKGGMIRELTIMSCVSGKGLDTDISDGGNVKTQKTKKPFKLVPTDDYSLVFSIMRNADPLMLSRDKRVYIRWYADACHKVRHGVTRIFILRQGLTPIATASLFYENPKICFLSDIAVKKKYQNKGIGKRLMQSVVSVCGQKTVKLFCDSKNTGFYERCGFAESGEAALQYLYLY